MKYNNTKLSDMPNFHTNNESLRIQYYRAFPYFASDTISQE